MNTSTSYRIEQRNSSYMRSPANDDCGHSEFSVNLRKKKRMEIAKMRRKKIEEDSEELIIYQPITESKFSKDSIIKILEGINEFNISESIKRLKKACSGSKVFELLNFKDLIKELNKFLGEQWEDEISSQIMSLWVKLFSGRSITTASALDCIGLSTLARTISPSRPKTSRNAISALANVAGDCSDLRILILAEKVQKTIKSFMYSTTSIKTLESISFFFANITRENHSFSYEEFEEFLESLQFLLKFNSPEIYINCLFALHSMIYENNRRLQAFLNMKIMKNIIQLVLHPEQRIRESALKIVGDVSLGNFNCINELLDCQLLGYLVRTAQEGHSSMRRETCYISSNVIASGQLYLKKIIEDEFCDLLVKLIEDNDFSVVKEASFVFYNISQIGKFQEFEVLVRKNVLSGVKYALMVRDTTVLRNFLTFVKNVVGAYESNSNFEMYNIIECSGIIEQIEKLQKHMNPTIYGLVSDILSRFTDKDVEIIEESNEDTIMNLNI